MVDCQGPCLPWCSNHNNNAVAFILVFVVGLAIGALAARACFTPPKRA